MEEENEISESPSSEARRRWRKFSRANTQFSLFLLSPTHTHSLPILCAAAREGKGKNKCLPPRFSGSPSFSLLIASAVAAQSWHCRVWERNGRLFSCFRVQFLGLAEAAWSQKGEKDHQRPHSNEGNGPFSAVGLFKKKNCFRRKIFASSFGKMTLVFRHC